MGCQTSKPEEVQAPPAPPADADQMAEESGKYEKYFSEKPGEGS